MMLWDQVVKRKYYNISKKEISMILIYLPHILYYGCLMIKISIIKLSKYSKKETIMIIWSGVLVFYIEIIKLLSNIFNIVKVKAWDH